MNTITTRVFTAAIMLAIPLCVQVSAQTPPATATRPMRPAGNGSVVTGTVKDDTGGVIPGASVALSNNNGIVQTVQSGGDGNYTFRGVPPGTYTVSATYAGLQQKGIAALTVTTGRPSTSDITMALQAQRQEVTVTDSSGNSVSTEPANNATALVLKPEDLDALPDDPDDLQADLQALAGPSAGPGGNQIYIDGFTGGRLPPKESIREIRVNSNPFSSEFDKLGYGRIQIFTKPGSDKFHGQAYYNISDGLWNSRNPFSTVNPPFRSQLFGGNVSGPIGKKASFFVDVERRQIDDNGIIVAAIPNSDFTATRAYGTPQSPNYFSTPQRRTTISPRIDYQINANNTLSMRYNYLNNDRVITGVGGFNLPSTQIGNTTFGGTGYSDAVTENGFQLVETSVLSPRAVNETHFQFDRERENIVSQSQASQLFVGQSFVVGGSGYSSGAYPSSYDLQNNFELQNYTSLTLGAHTTKFGIRIRAGIFDNLTPKNFNGIYQFLGGTFPVLDANNTVVPGQSAQLTSTQQYLTTERLIAAGANSSQITALGYGPSKYTVSAGNPYVGFSQTDFGPFIQDDWRVRPNLTVSLGLRFESQTNIYDHSDWAPRFAFAWSPATKGGSGKSKTVIRGGWGVFYDRFSSSNVETARRYLSGDPQRTYSVAFPNNFDPSFTNPISLSGLSASSGQVYQIDRALQAPRLMQTAIGVERQLFKRTTLAVNFTNSRGVHVLRTADINAPIPIVGQLPPGTKAAAGVTPATFRPFGDSIGDIYDYQSDGIFKQTQVLVNVNTTVGKLLTLFSRYSYTTAHSDTDGLSTLPSNPYDYAQDYGRSVLNVTHSLFLGGSISAKWGIRLSPFLVLRTGTPFNITTGTDLYLQGNGTPTARPSLLSTPTLSSVNTPYGLLNPYPLVGDPVIERNAGTGAGFIGLNLRVSKTWGFGPTKFKGSSGGASAGGGGGRGGFGGGGFGGGGGGPRGGGPGGGGESSEHRYNMTFSVNARNILNHENLNTFNGSITSPYFLQPTNITGGFGAEATASNQRRLDLQLRFAF